MEEINLFWLQDSQKMTFRIADDNDRPVSFVVWLCLQSGDAFL